MSVYTLAMVKNLFKNGADLLFRRQTNILSAATIIATTVLLSKILGLAKNRLLTAQFTPAEIGVFLSSFRLPSIIFDLIVMGALTTAFIPVFTSYLSKRKEEEANRIASTVLNLATIIFFFLSLILIIFTDPLVRLIAPGLTNREIDLVITFTRIMIVGQTLPLLLGNFLTGILQSHKRFLLPALAPVVYNVGIIIGIIFLAPTMGLNGAVWGVVIGAVLFLLIQIPLVLRLNFHYRPIIEWTNRGVLEIGRLFVPRLFGLGVSQLNYLVTFSISTLFSARGITIFYFAQQLEQLPVSIFAATISQAALPTLSEENGKEDGLLAFKKTFLTSFHQILYLVLPAAAILIVLRIPIVRLVYGASELFDWPATVDTGRTLAFLGVGLIAESLINLLVRGFFAMHDSKTPVIIGAITVALNVSLSAILVLGLHFPIWGLALAMAVTDSIYAVVLLGFLYFRVHHMTFSELVTPALKMFAAAGLTGLSLYIPMKLLDQLVFDTTRTVPLIMLTSVAFAIGLSVYLFLTWLFDIHELEPFLALFGRAKRLLFAAEETVSEVVTEVSPTISDSPNKLD